MSDPDLAKIQEIFPGAELVVPEPAKRICLLSDLRVTIVLDMGIYADNPMTALFKVDVEGLESGEPIDVAPKEDGSHFRIYICTNCGWQCDGSDEFETARAHLGKRNPFLHPFGNTL